MTQRPPSSPDLRAQTSTPVREGCRRRDSSLKRFIGRFLRSRPDIDDITQEAFLRAYAVERTRPIQQPKSFVFRIAKHVALSQLTRKSRQIADYIEDPESSIVIQRESSAEDDVGARQILGMHCEAVAELSPQCRQVYLLRKVHGFSHKEIAGQLGIAVSTVEKHLIKAVEECDRYLRDTAVAQPSCAPSQVSHGRVRGRK